MSYALVIDEVITQQASLLPSSARRLDDGQWVMDLPTAQLATQQACGWFQVVQTTRPPDTATTTSDSSVELVDGYPTVVWTSRPKTTAEIDADTARAARTGEDDRARQIIGVLHEYLAIESPTATQLHQQVDRLTRIAIYLVRDI